MSVIDLIFMALQMVWELIKVYPLLSALIVLVAVLPWLCVLIRGTPLRAILNRSTFKSALWKALLCGVIAFFVLPWFFKSDLGELRYFVDWLFHIASALSIAAYALLIFLPICACRRHGKGCPLSSSSRPISMID
ncbi:MAG: hypothetical protein Q4G42_02310 [Neisseria sp.]|nr:hypothetical protein [Neisseria sp.]